MSKIEELRAQLAEEEQKEKVKREKKRTEYVQMKNVFVDTYVNQFITFKKELTQLKSEIFNQGEELNNRMYDIYNREKKTDAKSFSIQNEAKTMKIVIEDAERLVFAPEANIGLEMMYECLKRKFEKRNKTMYTIIDKLLTRNRHGDYDPKMLVKLRELESEVNDEQYTRALAILTEHQVVEKTGVYVRAYKKDKLGKWEDISLQFSTLKI